MIRQLMSRQFVLFVVVGGISALIDIGVFELLNSIAMRPPIASGVGFAVSTVFNYWANKHYVFKNRFTWGNFTRYFSLVAVNLVISVVVVWIGDEWHVVPTASKLVSMAIVVVVNYFIARRWVFRNPRETED